MTQKEALIISLVCIIFSMLAVVQPQTVKVNHDKCTVNLIAPKRRLKHSLQDIKIKTLEKQLTLLRTEVNALNQILQKTTHKPPDILTGQEYGKEKTINVENIYYDTKQDNSRSFDWNEELPTKEYIMRLTVSFFNQKFSRLKKEIVTMVQEYLNGDVKEHNHAKINKRDTNQFTSDDFEFMNLADSFEPEYTYDNDFPHRHHESALDRQLNKLTRIIERELNQYKHDVSKEEPAVSNELPETRSQNVVQSDSQFGLSIEKIFDMLRNEVRNALQQQSRNVKITLNKHLDSVETKMTQILTLMEGMKSSYDQKFKNLLPTAISNGNKRIEQIETDIASLEAGITSLRGNIISDPIIRDQLQQIHVQLQQELSKTIQPVESELQDLQDRTERNTRLYGTTESSLQNFKADMREKVHFMEINITKLEIGLKNINSSVTLDQKERTDSEAREQEQKVQDTILFVQEIKAEWPFIWTNITNLGEICNSTTADTKFVMNNIQADIDTLDQNQTSITSQINGFRISLDKLSTRINRIKQVNIKLALEYDEWVEYDFKHTLGHSSCYGGKKYIKKTQFSVGRYVGVLLCSKKRYKIYLSNDISETFLDIGDSKNFGEDHCEFVGALRSRKIKVGRATHRFRRIQGKLYYA